MLNDIGFLESLKVTVLLDDNPGFKPGFLTQHGLSLLLEATLEGKSQRILLDVGQSAEPILHNMKILGIEPGSVDMIVLSHCHEDHASGLLGMLKAIKKEIPVIAHPDIFRHTVKYTPLLTFSGMALQNSREEIAKHGGRLILRKAPLPLMKGIMTSGEVDRVTDFEFPGIGGFNIDENTMVPDTIKDDFSIIARVQNKGLFLITGCSHSGIVNILKHSIKITGVNQILGLMGGLHMVNSSKDTIDKTLQFFKEMNMALICPGHCTGIRALGAMMEQFPQSMDVLHVGKTICV